MQVKGDLQILPELVSEVRIDFQDLEQGLSWDTVQVTVRDGVHVCIGTSRFIVKVNQFPKDVVLSCRKDEMLQR